MKKQLVMLATAFSLAMSLHASAAEVFLSELHYDTAPGSDTFEFVEIYVKDTVDISMVNLDLYNGNGGGVYNTFNGSAMTAGPTVNLGGMDFIIYDVSTPGIQNGAPDGLSVSIGANVVEFISYEGSFTATDGPAVGFTSVDIGSFGEPETDSVQRDDANMFAVSAHTRGAANSGITVMPEALLVPEPAAGLFAIMGFLGMFVLRRK